MKNGKSNFKDAEPNYEELYAAKCDEVNELRARFELF